MSLPRADYDPRRVCLNPFPEFTLGKHRRTVGVYIAGALVGIHRLLRLPDYNPHRSLLLPNGLFLTQLSFLPMQNHPGAETLQCT